MGDAFNLARFVDAQQEIYHDVLEEIRAGLKRSHWMWFVFPQLAGLGRSGTARFYGLGSLEEARAYLAHPLLGARLAECTEAMLAHRARSAEAILGATDAMKFRSSMTLFEAAAKHPERFAKALQLFCDGEKDELTLRLLNGSC